MKAAFKYFSGIALAAAMLSSMTAQAEVTPGKQVDVPFEDVRGQSAEDVQKRALHFAKDGIVVIYSGEAAQLQDVVRDVAGECATRGFQVRAVLVAKSESGDGVVLYGQLGGPLGPVIRSNNDVKSQTAVQIEQLRERLDRIPTAEAAAAIDPMDVVRCRYLPTTGSLVRKTKVCTTPRQDAERTRNDKQWTEDRQNRGANEAMPNAG